MLLSAVVEVALELASLGVACRDDAGPAGTELVVRLLQLVQRRLQRRVELDVVERERDLASELCEHPVVLFGVLVAAR